MNRKAQITRGLAAVVIALVASERAMAQKAAAPAATMPAAPEVRRVVVNIPALELRLYRDGKLDKSYRIAVGKPSTPSPTGNFKVARMVKNPVWNGPKNQVAAPGPQNPVGTRWMGLDEKGYGIHGTNAPNSIGRAASHGCIRMKNADAEDLFARIQVGDAVEIIYDLAGAGPAAKDVYSRALVAKNTVESSVAAIAANGGN